MTYPNGREVAYGHGAPGGMDDGLSRLAGISDGGASRASFKYLGLSTPVKTEFTEPGLACDLWGGAPGQYDGLDPFLRVKDLRWTGSGGDRVRIKHGYDRDSNRLWRENPVAAAAGHPQDQLYAYDRLNRLIQMQRGLLNEPHTGLTQKEFEQAWGLDKAGNWSGFRQDDDGSGTWAVDQVRRTNKGNEIVGIGAQSGPAWATPSYDAAGNTRSFPKPNDPTGSFGAKYDAWNRLVKVTDGEATVAEYAYDGRSFRTKKTAGGATRHYYYSSGWQVLEERVDSAVERQHVWGLGINLLILRDRDSDEDGMLDERLYALQDAHWDVCAVADAAGNVLERYEYEAYGQPRILTPSFDTRPSSLFAWEVLFQGSARDAETGLYQVRHRYYHPVLGSWTTRDPLFDHWGGNLVSANGEASVTFPTSGKGTMETTATCSGCSSSSGNEGRSTPQPSPVGLAGRQDSGETGSFSYLLSDDALGGATSDSQAATGSQHMYAMNRPTRTMDPMGLWCTTWGIPTGLPRTSCGKWTRERKWRLAGVQHQFGRSENGRAGIAPMCVCLCEQATISRRPCITVQNWKLFILCVEWRCGSLYTDSTVIDVPKATNWTDEHKWVHDAKGIPCPDPMGLISLRQCEISCRPVCDSLNAPLQYQNPRLF